MTGVPLCRSRLAPPDWASLGEGGQYYGGGLLGICQADCPVLPPELLVTGLATIGCPSLSVCSLQSTSRCSGFLLQGQWFYPSSKDETWDGMVAPSHAPPHFHIDPSAFKTWSPLPQSGAILALLACCSLHPLRLFSSPAAQCRRIHL